MRAVHTNSQWLRVGNAAIQWIYTDSVGPSARIESIKGGSHVE